MGRVRWGQRAVFVHGSTTWGESAFARQRPLAAGFRMELADRRGYGRSPDIDHSDALVDARDVAELVGRGPVHLVGHSFGTVVALLVAGTAVAAIRSLTLIEPSCYRVVADDPVVGAALERNRLAISEFRDRRLPSAEEYLRLATAGDRPAIYVGRACEHAGVTNTTNRVGAARRSRCPR